MSASYLVEADQLAGFLATVEQLDERLGPRCRLWAVGPLPPYSFTEAEAAWDSSAH